MIAEFTIENYFSIKSAQKISFEPSADTFLLTMPTSKGNW